MWSCMVCLRSYILSASVFVDLKASSGLQEQAVHLGQSVVGGSCQELTTLWVARLDEGAELKVTDPEEQQGGVEEEEAEG